MNRWHDLRPRLITSIFIGACTIVLLLLPQPLQIVLLLVWAGLVMHEAVKLVHQSQTRVWFKSIFLLTISLGLAATLWLVGLQYGLLLLVISVWTFDVSAYFGGKHIGGRKLAPSISPGKTWSGLLTGIVALSMAYGLIGLGLWLLLVAPLAGIVMQGSDLLQSAMKRGAYVKDSGNTLPGHGGWLDRYDSTMAAAPLWVLLLEFVI